MVGGRAEPTVVRHGADEARVDARFVDGDARGGAHPRRAGERAARVRTSTGARPRSQRSPTPPRDLVDLHGQHAHQQLLSPATQRAALDALRRASTSARCAPRGPGSTEIDAELAALGGDERARARELDLARFQRRRARRRRRSTTPTRTQSLERRGGHARRRGRAPWRRRCRAYEVLAGDGGGRDALAAAVAALARPSALPASWPSASRAVLAELDDIAARGRATSPRASSPTRSGSPRCAARRQQLRDLCRKYGDDLGRRAALPRRGRRSASAELEGYEAAGGGARRGRRGRRSPPSARRPPRSASARRAAAPRLAAAVTQRLRALAMPHADAVGRRRRRRSRRRRRVAARGEPRLAAAAADKVASGGELARTMLALRLVAVDDSDDRRRRAPRRSCSTRSTPASAVPRRRPWPRRWPRSASDHQVLVVTHLAQVAARRRPQITVTKRSPAAPPHTAARPIDGDERVDEIARMLSGERGGEAARRHAAQLLGAVDPRRRRPRPR